MKELQNDPKFANAVGLNWYDDNVFEELKDQDLINKRLATVNALKAVVDDANKPYFSTEFLIREYLKMSDEDIQKNKDYQAVQTGEAEEAKGGAGGAGAPGGGGGAAAAGAEGAEGGGEFKTELGAKGQL
jgi:hypothetical protein